MYRLGEAEKSHRKFYVFLFSFILLLIVAGALVFHFLKVDTQIGKAAAPVTTHLSYDTTQLVTFNTPLFSVTLPSDWKATVRNQDIPKPAYAWQGTLKDNASRWISIYVDQNVANLAVNRALSVQANGRLLNVLSDVSDNCTTFTGTNQGGGRTPAKWQGIAFTCDSGNYERDVVGTVSADGLNNVTLTGSSGAPHHFFITYTDNSVSPDYSIFINAANSIKLK